jgi:hypothetical protein
MRSAATQLEEVLAGVRFVLMLTACPVIEHLNSEFDHRRACCLMAMDCFTFLHFTFCILVLL